MTHAFRVWKSDWPNKEGGWKKRRKTTFKTTPISHIIASTTLTFCKIRTKVEGAIIWIMTGKELLNDGGGWKKCEPGFAIRLLQVKSIANPDSTAQTHVHGSCKVQFTVNGEINHLKKQ